MQPNMLCGQRAPTLEKLLRRWQKRAWPESKCCNAYETFADMIVPKKRG